MASTLDISFWRFRFLIADSPNLLAADFGCSRQDDNVTGGQFCEFQCIVTEKNATNGATCDVEVIRGGD